MFTALIVISCLLFASLLLLTIKFSKLKQETRKIELELNRFRTMVDEITGDLAERNQEVLSPDTADILTGLPARKVFEDRLNQTLSHCDRQRGLFAVMALDIDGFSDINKLGDDVGDKLLKELGQRLQSCIRQVDTVTRLAGGYFLFLLPHLVRAETAIYVAQRVQDCLLEAFEIDDHVLHVTVSIGIAVYPIDGAETELLIKSADEAMHQAKQAGKNKYQFFQGELHHLGERELSIAQLVRSKDLTKQLQIQYHPFFDVNTNKPVYIQATPHLHHPKYGMIPFSTFRNVAETSGKMLEVNEWLLRNAIAKFKQWCSIGFKPEVLAIPLSLRQLESPHLIYKIREIREELSADSITLVLEISDDNVPQNTVYLGNLFLMLSELNIKAAVGVMALGHFAMQKINKIPLGYLKIDTKIIRTAMQQYEKENILSKIIELARDEKVTVMAEGVENEVQKARLRKLGCELMEGKAFGLMMPTGSVVETEA